MTKAIAVHCMCLRCKFWHWNANYSPKNGSVLVRRPPKTEHDCRRYPPVPIRGPNSHVTDSAWPNTDWGNYCGEFKIDKRLYNEDD